jgi:hypothetical protein
MATAYNHRRHPIYDYETGLRLVYVRLPLNMTCDQVPILVISSEILNKLLSVYRIC